jgi:ATP/ADP translocase
MRSKENNALWVGLLQYHLVLQFLSFFLLVSGVVWPLTSVLPPVSQFMSF